MRRFPLNNVERLMSKDHTHHTHNTRRKYLLKDFHARVIHDDPYIVKLKNFISDDEIRELRKLAEGKFERSNMMANGELYYDQGRTSSTAYIMKDGLPDYYGETLEKFIKRICYLANCERGQIEGLMMVRYRKGQKFDSHVDYFEKHEIGSLDTGGQRMFTFFVYLNTLHEGDGGETEFTKLGIKSKPRARDSLFWVNQDPVTGEMKPMTEHSGNPVLRDGVTKYGLNVWVRSKCFE